MDITTLADIGQITSPDTNPRSRITVARLGKYSDPRYGKFEISEADFDGWQRNLSDTFGGKVAVDWDHSSDRGQGTEASAWITGLERQGKDVIADVEWTPRGAAAIRDKSYQFISPTYTEHYKDETGTDRGRALIGAALTNRPVLRQLPTLSLAREDIPEVATVWDAGSKRERRRARTQVLALAAADAAFTLAVSADERKLALKEGNSLPDGSYPIRNTAQLHAAAILAASGHGDAAGAKKLIARRAKELGVPMSSLPGMGKGKKQMAGDSRPAMDLKALAQKLDLPEDSDESTLLAKVDELKTLAARPEETPEPTQLGQANQDGTVTLAADQLAELMTNANLGAAAAKQLSEQTFQLAWSKALTEGRAAPSQEDTLRELFGVDPALAVKTLAGFQPIVPVRPSGSGEAGADQGATPAGMDPDRFTLHTEAKQLAAQKLSANPKLDEAEAYILAAQEIEERQFALAHPGI